MTVLKEAWDSNSCKKVWVAVAKHTTTKNTPRSVRFPIKPEIVGDKLLQSTDTRRRYMRRGSRSPSMIAIDAVRSSAEVAKIEAHDQQHEKLERQSKLHLQTNTHEDCPDQCVSASDQSFEHDESLTQHIRRSLSLPGKRRTHSPLSKEFVNTELALSLFQKAHLTDAQKRRLSLEILSRVELDG